ncbi:MAG: hypothetical protein ACE5HE_13535, partial [Phycisphaerae bacterium]
MKTMQGTESGASSRPPASAVFRVALLALGVPVLLMMGQTGGCPYDECDVCRPVGEGSFNVDLRDNTGLTDDDTSCAPGDVLDEWYCYTPSCNGVAVASTCTEFAVTDITLAAFDQCGGRELACGHDNPGCFFGSTLNARISWPAVAGRTYYVRISGVDATPTSNFTGSLTLDCVPCRTSSECDDRSVCTTDSCINGVCVNAPINCSDGNECTTDTCDPTSGCQHTNNSNPCDDGVFCNGSDTCRGGTCSLHAGNPCPGADGDADCSESCDETTNTCAANDPDGSACDDGAFCNGVDKCRSGRCDLHTGNPCPGPDGDANCAESCNEELHECTLNDPDGSACTDGMFCNGSDRCLGGRCSAHTGDPCATGSDCANRCNETVDNCNAPSGTVCTDDGNACTSDRCDGQGNCAHFDNGLCGACCDESTGVCTDHALSSECTGTLDVWYQGRLCTDPLVPCEPPQACCFGAAPGAAPCIDLPVPACLEQNGTPLGAGTRCASTVEACCSADGACRNLDPACCIAFQGSPQGPGSACGDLAQSCCGDNGSSSCAMVDPLCCDDIGGSPSPTGEPVCLGDANGDQIDDACDTVPPTCAPTADGQACMAVGCPTTALACVPSKIRLDFSMGTPVFEILACACAEPGGCHVDFDPPVSPFCSAFACASDEPCDLIEVDNGNETFDYECQCRPPAVERDLFQETSALIQLMGGPLGTSPVPFILRGPAEAHVFFEGPVEGIADDDDGNGRDEVDTELVSMHLTDGAVTLQLNPSMPSLGQIEELINNNVGLLDLDPFAPGDADSFFDVWFEISVAGMVLHNEQPLHIQAVIREKPPIARYFHIVPPGAPVQLFDQSGAPTEVFIVKAQHYTGHVEIDDFPLSAATVEIVHPSGMVELVDLSGPTRAAVYFESFEGQARDDGGNGLDEVDTELVSMDLTGMSSMGPVHVGLHPALASTGQIEERSNAFPGLLDLPPFAPAGTANSFFDVFFEIQLGDLVLRTHDPKRMSSVITHKPPDPGNVYENPNRIELFDLAGNPTGYFLGAGRHEPNPGATERDFFEETSALIQLMGGPLGTSPV